MAYVFGSALKNEIKLYYKFIIGISINLLFRINGLLLGIYTPG